MTDAATHFVDIGLHAFAEIGHLVDETDLGREQRVGDVFGHLRTLGRHDQKRVLGAEIGQIEMLQHIGHSGRTHSHHHPIGLLKILDGSPLLEEFGVAGHATVPPGALEQAAFDAGAGADRHRALGDHHCLCVQIWGDRVDHRPEGGQIGRTVGRRGRADGEKHDLGGADRPLGVGGEEQSAGLPVALHHFFKPRLIDRHLTPVETLDLGGIDVQTGDGVAAVGETGS